MNLRSLSTSNLWVTSEENSFCKRPPLTYLSQRGIVRLFSASSCPPRLITTHFCKKLLHDVLQETHSPTDMGEANLVPRPPFNSQRGKGLGSLASMLSPQIAWE